MAAARTIPLELVTEGARMARVCNACRYCEGFCAVFPALERRLTFAEADLNYLANLCHNCGACLYACQYAPPHEFALNFPEMLARIRGETYKKYAWPGVFARLFERNGLVVSLVAALALAAFLIAMSALVDPAVLHAAHPDNTGSFYAVMPHRVMASTFGAVTLFVLVALGIGMARFWRETGESAGDFFRGASLQRATSEALRLKYLGGSDDDDGCTYPGERPSLARRRFHHLTFYGFMLCFAATTVAAIYHYVLGWPAPYPRTSLPVALGVAGGIGLIAGPIGLLWLRAIRDKALTDERQTGMDVGFLVLLVLSSISGLALLVLRETSAMGVLLAVHLAFVMALFLTLPYGKFVHAIYRFAALVRHSLEQSRPAPKFLSD
ncbi:MAG TPA: tricarballylate utilization 4Fe-4S protein TcuB [Casimicrobiaceae bacterium]|jgi:citrate/tricarballylate utilization protein